MKEKKKEKEENRNKKTSMDDHQSRLRLLNKSL